MNFEDSENWATTECELEPYSGRVDRFLIFVGDKATRYAAVLLFFVILGVMGLSMAAGGLFLAQQVGERFNELDLRVQEREALLEQQIEQTTHVIEKSSQARIKVIDESEWFVVLEEGEELLQLAEEESTDVIQVISELEFDGSQQFVETTFEAPASLDDIRATLNDDITASN